MYMEAPINNNLVNINITDKLIPMVRESTRNYYEMAIQIPLRREPFYTRTINEWNLLLKDTITSTSLDQFKAVLPTVNLIP